MDESSINPDRVLMEELQGKLTKSAEIGKHLLQECEMLREQMEAERNDYTAKIEVSVYVACQDACHSSLCRKKCKKTTTCGIN